MKKLGDESYGSVSRRSRLLAGQKPVRAWSTNYATAVTSLWAGSTMLCSRTLDKKLQAFRWAPRKIFGIPFLGIPRRGSQFMFSYVACAMTTSPEHRLVHQLCRQCRGTPRVSPTADPSHSWRAFDKGAVPVPRIHLPRHPQQETGRASKPRDWSWEKPGIPGQSSRIAIHMVLRRWVRGSACWDAHRLWQVLVLLQCEV